MCEYLHNIGKIVLRYDECFWLCPCALIYKRNSLLHSPYFSYLNEKWQLVIQTESGSYEAHLYLWRSPGRNLPNGKYAVNLKLETSNVTFGIGYRKGDLTHDYGFEAKNFCRIDNTPSYCGLIKIIFEIKEKYNADDVPSLGALDAVNNKDDIKQTDETSSEDEASSEDEIRNDEKNTEKKNVSSNVKGMKRLVEDFKQIFLDGRLSDAVLKVDDHEFNVHKVVLVARSPVFASMFEHDMAEKKDNEVNIPDCTSESFEVFLHYLYSGSVETVSACNVYNVYYAADKYCVNDLKKKCVKYMIKYISVETFCDVITLSLRHGESKLQKTATDFFCQNIRKIVKTDQWQKYMDENSTQANELLIKALNA